MKTQSTTSIPVMGAKGAYNRRMIQHGWGEQYAQEQREWHAHTKGITPGEMKAYLQGVKDGHSHAVALLFTHDLIRRDKVSE